MPKLSWLEVIETGARRCWTVKEKFRIVAERFSSPRPATARRRGLSANQLFVWRRLARERKLGGESALPEFVPALFVPEHSAGSGSAISTSLFVLGIGKLRLTHALSAREPKVILRNGVVRCGYGGSSLATGTRSPPQPHRAVTARHSGHSVASRICGQ